MWIKWDDATGKYQKSTDQGGTFTDLVINNDFCGGYGKQDVVNHWIGIGPLAPANRFHVSGTSASHIGRFDIGLDLYPVVKPTTFTPVLLNQVGNVDAGTHRYYLAFYTDLGYTELTSATGDITADASHGQVQVPLQVSSDYRVIGRKLFRTTAGSSYYSNVKLVADIANNTDVSYTDNKSDASLTGTNYFLHDNSTYKGITLNGNSLFYAGSNLIFGNNAGLSIFNGTAFAGENVLIGSSSGRVLTTGSKNVLIGSSTGYNGTTLDSSVAIGHSALVNARACSGNIGIGRNAGYYTQDGSNNVIIGNNAFFGVAYNNAVSNTIIGHNAGYQSGGNTNVFIGHKAGYYETGSDKLFIDNAQRASEADGRVKALIYGVFNAATALQEFHINAVTTILHSLAWGGGAVIADSSDVSQVGHTHSTADLTDVANVPLKDAANVFTQTNTIPQVNANKIQFPAAQSASADVNCLDDYEEGDWTPVIGGSASESGQTYDIQIGKYTKIGNIVHVWADVRLTAKGTITGSVGIKGLPYQVNSAVNCMSSAVYWSGTASSYVTLAGAAQPNTYWLALYGATAAATALTALATANIGNTTRFIISASYMTAT